MCFLNLRAFRLAPHIPAGSAGRAFLTRPAHLLSPCAARYPPRIRGAVTRPRCRYDAFSPQRGKGSARGQAPSAFVASDIIQKSARRCSSSRSRARCCRCRRRGPRCPDRCSGCPSAATDKTGLPADALPIPARSQTGACCSAYCEGTSVPSIRLPPDIHPCSR